MIIDVEFNDYFREKKIEEETMELANVDARSRCSADPVLTDFGRFDGKGHLAEFDFVDYHDIGFSLQIKIRLFGQT